METATMMTGIYISEKAKSRVGQLLQEEGRGDDYFVRVSVVSGGCSGLTYKMDFDNYTDFVQKYHPTIICSDIKLIDKKLS